MHAPQKRVKPRRRLHNGTILAMPFRDSVGLALRMHCKRFAQRILGTAKHVIHMRQDFWRKRGMRIFRHDSFLCSSSIVKEGVGRPGIPSGPACVDCCVRQSAGTDLLPARIARGGQVVGRLTKSAWRNATPGELTQDSTRVSCKKGTPLQALHASQPVDTPKLGTRILPESLFSSQAAAARTTMLLCMDVPF